MWFRLSNSATTCHALTPFRLLVDRTKRSHNRNAGSSTGDGRMFRKTRRMAAKHRGERTKILCTVVKWARSGQMAGDVAVLQRNHSESPDLCVV